MERTKTSISNEQISFLAIEAFKSTGYLIVNKTLINQFGLIPAVLISNYIDKHIYFSEHNPDFDGWFFLTHEKQMEQLNIGEHSIIKYKNYLIEKGILKTMKRGIPAKEWFKINFQNLVICLNNHSSKILDTPISRGQDTPISRGLFKDTKYKDTKNIERLTQNKQKNIIPPTLDMVKDYCKERKNKVDPNVFYDWNTSKGWVIGKSKMKDWQAAVRTWEKRDSSSNGYSTTTKFIKYDGIKYTLCPDGRYRSASGEVYID